MGNDAFWGIGLLEKVWYNVVRKVGNLSFQMHGQFLWTSGVSLGAANNELRRRRNE
jgi:hypothetical protein